MRARGLRELTLVARREVATRMRGTAFRVSTIVLLAATVAGIAIAAALTGHPQRFTVAVTAQAPPAVAAMVRADGQAAGLRITAVPAGRLGIYLGAGAAESDGTDFFNVFTLASPDGQIAGRAYKANAEASIFRRGRSAHLIDTRAGRIGIGICADNQLAATLRIMHEQRADLILMPHAWPTPARAAGLVSQADVAAQQRRMTELPVLYAHALGVPVVFVNQVGPLLPIGGILGHLMDPRIWRLRGQSRIVDSDGSVLGQLAEDEGVLTADVVMDPARKHYDAQPSFGGWLQPGPWAGRHLIIPLDIAAGRLSYAISRERRQKARAAAERTNELAGMTV